MEKTIKIKNEYNSLDTLYSYLKTATSFESSKEYDSWEVRTNIHGQMEQCLVLKKSNMHGMKVYFENENSLKMTYIIPNKIMQAYFGNSQKRYQNVLEIVTGKIKNILLTSSQNKAFKEMEQVFLKISA
ncbi:hypothetical protein HNV08_08270 [Winogradskyella eckloniae]|uniref:hypothetical protein n=1 Tax=Winogradskyella eckloniae TaxID=1089306 RepID=UPI0015646DE9|nr:hypothetical protein [Winogradskyella eckloniae]NRD20041.1 hypothetical protein [Winogradskyella eckloniae]